MELKNQKKNTDSRENAAGVSITLGCLSDVLVKSREDYGLEVATTALLGICEIWKNIIRLDALVGGSFDSRQKNSETESHKNS